MARFSQLANLETWTKLRILEVKILAEFVSSVADVESSRSGLGKKGSRIGKIQRGPGGRFDWGPGFLV